MSIYKNNFLGKTEILITSHINLRSGILFLISAILIWLTLKLNLGYEKTVILIGLELAAATIFWQLKVMDRTAESWLIDFINFIKEKKRYIWQKEKNEYIYNVLTSNEPVTKNVKFSKKSKVKDDFKKIKDWEIASNMQDSLEKIIKNRAYILENEIYLKDFVYEKDKRKKSALLDILIILTVLFIIIFIFYFKNYYDLKSLIDFNEIKLYLIETFKKIRG